MPKQKKRLSRKQKKQKFKTVKAWLDEKDKKRRRQEAEELGKMTVDYRISRQFVSVFPIALKITIIFYIPCSVPCLISEAFKGTDSFQAAMNPSTMEYYSIFLGNYLTPCHPLSISACYIQRLCPRCTYRGVSLRMLHDKPRGQPLPRLQVMG